jgi:hypothetical protein
MTTDQAALRSRWAAWALTLAGIIRGDLLFSFEGRINRAKFWLGFLVIALVETGLDGVALVPLPAIYGARPVAAIMGFLARVLD